MDGLYQMHPDNFDPSIASRLDAAHFCTSSGDGKDMVSRLGGGHLGGENFYEIEMTETGANVLGMHLAWNYFNTLNNDNMPLTTTLPDYLNVDGSQKLAALIAYFGNDADGKMNDFEALYRIAGSLMVAISTASPSEMNQLINAMLPNAMIGNWALTIASESALASPMIRMELAVAGLMYTGIANGLELQIYQDAIEWTTDQIEDTVKLYELTTEIGKYALKVAIETGSDAVDAMRDLYIQTVDYASDSIMDLVSLYDSAIDYTSDKLMDLQNLLNQVGRWFGRQGGEFGGAGASGSWDGSISLVNARGLFNTSKTLSEYTSPIVLDLDRDGIETMALTDGAYFDLDKNGFAEMTGWASSDDGILALDKDNDGTIDDGGEVFGNNTLLANGQKAANGFQALTQYDTNTDGKIDSDDAVFSQLKVWQDMDGDGYSTPDELFSLSELGIKSINTGYADSTFVDANGNEHKQVGSFTWDDNTTSTAADVWFTKDMYTIANDWLAVPDDISILADLQGYGNVYDLHQVMVRDTSGQLKSLIQQFSAAADVSTCFSLMEQIVFKWAGSDGVSPTSRGANIDARRLVAMEHLFGETWNNGGNPGVNASNSLNQSFKGLIDTFYAQLMAQTHLKDFYDNITYTWDDTANTLRGDLTGAETALLNCINADPVSGKKLLGEFARSIRILDTDGRFNLLKLRSDLGAVNAEYVSAMDGAGKTLIQGTAGNDNLSGTGQQEYYLKGGAGNDYLSGSLFDDSLVGEDGNDNLTGNNGNDLLDGGAGDDTLNGGNGNDLLAGGTGNDILYGGNDNDILQGGAGNDQLYGGAGNDTYFWTTGGGHDYLKEQDGASDTINFGTLNSTDVTFFISPYNGEDGIRLRINATGENLAIANWFTGAGYKIENFQFADTTLTAAQVQALAAAPGMVGTEGNDTFYMPNSFSTTVYGNGGNDTISAGSSTVAQIVYGGAGNDYISGGTGNDVFYGEDGNDNLTGGNGNNSLYGGAGNDTLMGGTGNSLMDGGTGDDIIYGGTGNDTYVFSLGSGNDTISDSGADASTSDRVLFSSDVLQNTVALFQNGQNLIIGYGSTDKVTITNQAAADYGVEKIELNNGLFLTNTDVNLVIQQITAFASSHGITLTNVDNVRANQDLMNIIANSWHA
jgi:Ca2+-binding RTX toxin-like protein